jgi:hypothetical protein
MGISKTQGHLGFRDLVCFSKALLAKQCWTILKNPKSLVAQIIEAKYYPQSMILEATLGTQLSFAWISLMAACAVMKNGLVWRVGIERDICIWGDKWIPTPISFSIQSPQRILPVDAKVVELINQDTKWWNTPRIKGIF